MTFYCNEGHRREARDLAAGVAFANGRKIHLTEYERRALNFVWESNGQLRADSLANDFCVSQECIAMSSSTDAIGGLAEKKLVEKIRVPYSGEFVYLTKRGEYALNNNTTLEEDLFG